MHNAAGGTSQRLNPGFAIECDRSRKSAAESATVFLSVSADTATGVSTKKSCHNYRQSRCGSYVLDRALTFVTARAQWGMVKA
jgi:hypothetical protein